MSSDQPPLEEQEAALRAQAEESIRVGQEAADLLQHPLIVEALERWDAEVQARWRASKSAEVEVREQLYHASKAGERFRAYLQACVDAGKASAQTAARYLAHGGDAGSSGE